MLAVVGVGSSIQNNVFTLDRLPIGTVLRAVDGDGVAWVAHRVEDGCTSFRSNGFDGPLWVCDAVLTSCELAEDAGTVGVEEWSIIFYPNKMNGGFGSAH